LQSILSQVSVTPGDFGQQGARGAPATGGGAAEPQQQSAGGLPFEQQAMDVKTFFKS
jgi:hypothetical protein